ncbi:(2,3-dihydroxybenzoyl)adenylate synthase [Rhodococcoides kyotonense]|uniref:2,3-dihydroxybenzoate-AMP ligase n=1 Tax=Rhodococcoides kyotonense TaxID=398843 RepID=A0A239E153_9NOCA|nr:AMP-binding protein [Rhodococcus kyotonensis]SNS38416.1 2,3-dihydroxybenzoate-AMP ligase [Rhodococcus kyotonensis]
MSSSADTLAPLVLDGVVAYPEEFAARYRDKGYWIGQTHSDLLADTVSAHPARIAVVDANRSLTYWELADRVQKVAGELSARGIQRGDRVVVHMPNTTEFVEVVFALFELGALPVFALAAHRRAEIEQFCVATGAHGYVTVDRFGLTSFEDIAAEIDTAVAGLVTVVVPVGDPSWAQAEPAARRTRALPSDIAFLQLSGGTTGTPKLIPRTHDDYLYSVRESARICAIDETSVMLAALPISHNFTMSSPGLLGLVAVGGCVVMAPDPSPDTCLRLVEQHEVTHAALVPPVLMAWLNSSARTERDISSLVSVWVGGAKLTSEVARRVGPELGCALTQVFGMAEGLVNYTRVGDDDATVFGTQGRPISPDDEVRVVDDAGEPVEVGMPGHLQTRGPYTIRGYFAAPQHNRTAFTEDGFYATGDIVVQDARGYLQVVGRSKDQINRGGEKIAPAVVENHLLAHEAIHDVSVVGIPDPVLGEKICAFVIRRDSDSDVPTAGQLRAFLRTERKVAAYTVPDTFEFVSEFPTTSVGKIDKKVQSR